MSTRRVGSFVLRFLALDAALLLAWPLADGVYPALFRGVGNACVAPLFAATDADVSFDAFARGPETADTKILIASRTTERGRIIPVSSRLKGYLPAALLASLVLAMPRPARPRPGRGRALLLGLLLVHGFLALRMAVAVVHALSLPEGYAILRPGPVGHELIRAAWLLLYKSAGFAWGVSVVLWLLLCVRVGDEPAHEAPVSGATR